MRVRVLGPVDVERDGVPVMVGGRQQRRLFALFVLHRGHAVSTDRMVDALWPGSDAPEGAARSMRTYLSRLRSVLPEGSILTGPAGYTLELNGAWLDVREFDTLLRQAEQSVPDRALALYEEALALWRGEPFGEFATEWWALPESSRLLERWVEAGLGRAATQMAMGHHSWAIPDLERLTAERPLDERPVVMLMQALHVTGRQAEALRAGHAFRCRLADETGLDPSPQLAKLESDIAAGAEVSLAPSGRPLRGYRLHDTIGEGSSGRVYVATQPGTDRRVAIKAIRPDLADSTDFIRRFEAEAQLVARLEHPHIVPLYDYWREPGGAYLVFRLLTGGTARDSVIAEGPWSLPRVTRLVEEIGGALVSAHANGVVHNDVKASNILLDDEGAAYLTDFGIATTAEASGGAADACDLGWTACELLTGSPPANGGAPSLIGRVPAVPDGLDAVLQRATQGRYLSAAELLLGWRAATGAASGGSLQVTSSGRRAAAGDLEREANAGVNPYRGLRPYSEADESRFRGRDAAVRDLRALIATRRVVTVVGSSGSGKSSVVRAGLVPKLRAEGHVVVSMVPGDDPFGALRAAITEVASASDEDCGVVPVDALADMARRFGRIVVVVDQLEECWTSAPVEQRERFLDVVSGAVVDDSSDIRFVFTVRSDLLDRPLDHPAIGHEVGAGSYVLAPLSPAELEEATVGPAADAGVVFDEGVVAELVAEAVTYPGALPLLQFTLTEIYDRRVDGRITRGALEGIGGMAGAIGRRAETVYLALPEQGRSDARELFARLVTPGQHSPDTRRRALHRELSQGMREVAAAFVGARLLVTDCDPATREPTIEIAHEALLSRWSRLQSWVDEDRRWLATLQHLSASARAWEESDRGDAELYRGARLEAAIEAIDVDVRPVSDLERSFVEAGRAARDAEVVEARHSARRLRRRLTAVAIALAAALAGGVIAVVQRNDAQTARSAADEAARAARIEALVGRADSLRATQRDTAALLAVEAYRLADTRGTRSALLSTFTDAGGFYDASRIPGDGGGAGIVMPDGESAYVLDAEQRLRPYQLDTGALGDPLPPIGGPSGGTSLLIASADGRQLAQVTAAAGVGDDRTTVGVVDTATGTMRFAPIIVEGTVLAATFTAGGHGLALVIGEGARLLVVDSATGAERASVPGINVPADEGAVAMEPGAGDVGPARRAPGIATAGDELLLGAADGSLRILDDGTLETRRTFALGPDTLASIRPLSDGSVLTAGRRGVARVDLASGQVRWQHAQGVSAIGDGSSAAVCAHLTVIERRKRYYCGNAYGRLTEYDLSTGSATKVLDAQNGNSGTLWSARDDTELVSFGENEGIVSRWRLDGSGPITHLVAPGYRGWRFNPRGDLLVVERGGSIDGYTSKVVGVGSGDVVRSLDPLINSEWLDDDTVTGAIIRSDGKLETAHIDASDGVLVLDGAIVDPIPSSAAIDSGKERMLLVYRSGLGATLRQYDVRAQRLGPAIAVEGYVSSAISRSGHRIAAGTDRGIVIYDGSTGERLGTIPGTNLRGVFLTATDQLFVSSLGGELTRYDLDTLEPIRTFGGSRGFVTQLQGTADGTLIAAAGGDHSVILYDVATGARIGTPIGVADDEFNWISLSLDGRWLSLGGEADKGQHAIQIWDLDPAHWVAAACRVAGRNLTAEEWASNIGDLAQLHRTCPAFSLAG